MKYCKPITVSCNNSPLLFLPPFRSQYLRNKHTYIFGESCDSNVITGSTKENVLLASSLFVVAILVKGDKVKIWEEPSNGGKMTKSMGETKEMKIGDSLKIFFM